VRLLWAALERELGRHDRVELLLEAGMDVNPTDGALQQVCWALCWL
jgi:hypothetical protein